MAKQNTPAEIRARALAVFQRLGAAHADGSERAENCRRWVDRIEKMQRELNDQPPREGR